MGDMVTDPLPIGLVRRRGCPQMAAPLVGCQRVLGVTARYVQNCTLGGQGQERGANVAEWLEAAGRR
jgi:hypothetical protein